MTRRALAPAAVLFCALACSPAAAAATPSGIVLSVVRSRHRVEIVDAGHIVRRYAVRGALPGFEPGTRIRYRLHGAIATNLRPAGRVPRITLCATIVRLTRTAVTVRLHDGRVLRLKLAVTALRAASVSARLRRGSSVLITLTVSGGGKLRLAGAPKLTTQPVAGKGGAGSGQQVAGTVAALDQSAFTITTASGPQLRFSIDPAALAALRLSLCDVVKVTYHRAPGLVADTVTQSSQSSTGRCAELNGSLGSPTDPPDDAPTISGTITDMALGTLTITVPGQPSQTFPVATLDLLGGFSLGDSAVVTYTTGSNGAPLAVDVEYDDHDVTGTVTSVSAGSITLTADDTGQSLTFTDDPSNGSFDGISIGDSVDITYYDSNGTPAVNSVSDLSD